MVPRLVDTHAHLNARAFAADRDAVLAAALERLAHVVDVATDGPTAEVSLSLSAAHPRVWSTVGVHPHDAKSHDDAAVDRVLQLADRPKVVALGEMGLDYHYDFSPREDQQRVFARQVAEARRRKLPVVVHVREAFPDALAILGPEPIEGVIHCFTGTWDEAKAALDLGMHISFSGVVTFKNSDALREVAAKVPADRLLVETDSPYLTPHPYRNQKRNAPTMVEVTAQLIASLRGLDPDDVARLTTANACRLFRLPEEAP